MKKILVADDHEQITVILKEYLVREGFLVSVAHDGEEAYQLFKTEPFNMILLDVMMPKIDGFTLCKKIREESMVPIMMITARSEDYDRIMGIEIGADDYIVKPFNSQEVVARIHAILRRIKAHSPEGIVKVDNLFVNINTFEVKIDNQPIELTKKELDILYTLASNKEQVYSRDSLLDSVWGYDYYGDTRTVDSHIKRLRSKLNKVEHPNWDITTVWGIGYKFEVFDNE